MITWKEAFKVGGGRFECYETFSVLDGGKVIGMIQCKGPCWGFGAARNHTHGPWIAFVGPNSDAAKNLPGLHEARQDAIEAVVDEVRARASHEPPHRQHPPQAPSPEGDRHAEVRARRRAAVRGGYEG